MRRPSTDALAAALILWGAVAGLSAVGPVRDRLVLALTLYTLAYLALLHLWNRHRAVLDDPRVLLGGAVVLRLTLLPALPDLSDDLYRYVWDGWMSVSGINPYLYAPSDPVLTPYQGSVLFREMNSPDYHSVYPPLSQLLFLPGGFLYERLGWPAAAFGIKTGLLVLELAGIVFLLRALQALGRRAAPLALYAWNPLVLVTVAGNGHSEGGLLLGMGLLALGVAAARRTTAWTGLALAVLSKGVPLLLAPLLLRWQLREAGPRHALAAALPAALLGAVFWAPFHAPDVLSRVASSVGLYVRLFEFNAGPYLLLKQGLEALTGGDWSGRLGPALRWLLLAAALLVWIRWPLRRAEDWFRGALTLLGLYLVTATTVHPWYLNWGLAFVPLVPFLRGTWLWASWAAFLTYFTYVDVSHGLLAGVFWGGAALFLVRDLEPGIRDALLRVAGLRKARQAAPHLRGRTILDLGAGEGYVSASLAGGRHQPILADVGPYFRTLLPRFVYDGRRLPLTECSVDTVLLSVTLHHAEEPERVVSEALRVARRRVVVTESVYRWAWERRLLEAVDRCANRGRAAGRMEGEAAPLGFRTVREWEATFRRRGSRIVVSRRLNRIGHRHHLFVLEPDPGNPDPASGSSP